MPLYLIRPTSNPVGPSVLPLSHIRTTLDARNYQIKTVQDAVLGNTTYRNIGEWLKQEGVGVGKPDSISPPTGSLTGIRVADLTVEQADRITKQVSGVLVEPDAPVGLPLDVPSDLATVRGGASTKPPLQAASIGGQPGQVGTPWHLKMIGAGRGRKSGTGRTGGGIGVGVIDTGVGVISRKWGAKVQRFAVRGATAVSGATVVASPPFDAIDHGTPVTALILDDIVGAAPDADVISIRAVPGQLSDLIAAIEWAGSQPNIRILNVSASMPLGGPVLTLETLLTSLRILGVLTICAAGNNGRAFSGPPATCQAVISVGAVDEKRKVTSYSGSAVFHPPGGGPEIQIPYLVAPGHDVVSYSVTGVYRSFSGTSFAAPLVTAAAARFIGTYPRTSVPDVIEGLLMRCKPLSDRTRAGSGIVYVGRL
jgi:subtilisin family serine protease